MRNEGRLPAGGRSWIRWCATLLVLLLALVAVHQVVPHHPNHARCQVCTSSDRAALPAGDVGFALPRQVSFRLSPIPDEVNVFTDFYVLTPLRGPPALLAV